MLYVPFVSSAYPGEATCPLRLTIPRARPERKRIRHIVMGSREGVDLTVNTLDVLNYAEQRAWSEPILIPERGLLLTPEQGEVFRYLIRYRSAR